MPDYKKGKIYKVINDENDKFYLGCTVEKYLSNRMSSYRKTHNKCMSANLGVDLKDCSIILIESYDCKDINELKKKQREYYDKFKKEGKQVFLNKRKPRSKKEKVKEIIKKVSNHNREHINLVHF